MRISWLVVSKEGKQLTISPQEKRVKLFIKTIQEISLSYYHHFHRINGTPDPSAKIVGVQDIWSVHCYAGDYNPLHNHLCDTLQGLSDILYTKVPQPFRRTQLWTVAWSSSLSNRVADVYFCTI